MKIGTKLFSQACDGAVVVIRANGVAEPPEAGGVPMAPSAPTERSGEAKGAGFALGKRFEYVDESAGVRLELLVTSAGTSTLTWQGRELAIRATKPLPASD